MCISILSFSFGSVHVSVTLLCVLSLAVDVYLKLPHCINKVEIW